MVISSFPNTLSNLRTKTVKRTEPWYGKFNYCLTFCLEEAFSLRNLNHSHIDRILEIRAGWGRRMATTNYGGSWRGSWIPVNITEDTKKNLHSLCDFFLSETSEHKMMIASDWIHVYTNDLDLLGRISDLPFLSRNRMYLSHHSIVGEPGTVYLKKACYQYRSYFRYAKQELEQANHLRKFLAAQEHIRLSPSLQQWVGQTSQTVSEYFFIDHDDMGVLVMLGLLNPKIIRKTLRISTDK